MGLWQPPARVWSRSMSPIPQRRRSRGPRLSAAEHSMYRSSAHTPTWPTSCASRSWRRKSRRRPRSLGTVPFGSTTHSVVITQAQSDANFFARLVATSGNWLAVASYPSDNGSSDKILLYDITDRANPVYRRTVLSNSGAIRDLAIVNGWLILAADRVATLNLSDPNSAPILFGDPYGSDYAMTVVDGVAFTAEVSYNNDGRINVYDVSSPATPRYLRQQAVVGLYPYAFTGLAPLGSSYLVGVSTW